MDRKMNNLCRHHCEAAAVAVCLFNHEIELTEFHNLN